MVWQLVWHLALALALALVQRQQSQQRLQSAGIAQRAAHLAEGPQQHVL